MYKPDNRIANDVAAGLVRNSFADKQLDVAELSDKYYYLRTQDMVDFSGINFNKAIKTTKTRVLKQDKSLTTYYLSNADVFEIMIGDRVLSTDIVEDGDIPVYSANVHEEFGRINKKNIIDFSRPSVVWGIDGDWMVDYIPENKPFYPTDHCGVIRIKNDNILPKYLVYALQVEGEYERFSRANRASTQRIASLIIQVPELEKQKKIVAEIEAIDKQVKDEDNKLKKYDEDIKSKFVEMFGTITKSAIIKDLFIMVTKGTTPMTLGYSFVECGIRFIKVENINHNKICGEYTYIDDECNLALQRSQLHIDDILFSIAGTLGKVAIIDKSIVPANINQALAILRIENEELLIPTYLFYALQQEAIKEQIVLLKKVANRQNLSLDDINNFQIPLPEKREQCKFATYVDYIDKLRFASEQKKKELLEQKKVLFDKYFR